MKLADAEHALELNRQRDNLIGRAERILSHKIVKVSVGHHKTEEIAIESRLISEIIIRVTLEQISAIDRELVDMGFECPDAPFLDSDLREVAERVSIAMQPSSSSGQDAE